MIAWGYLDKPPVAIHNCMEAWHSKLDAAGSGGTTAAAATSWPDEADTQAIDVMALAAVPETPLRLPSETAVDVKRALFQGTRAEPATQTMVPPTPASSPTTSAATVVGARASLPGEKPPLDCYLQYPEQLEQGEAPAEAW